MSAGFCENLWVGVIHKAARLVSTPKQWRIMHFRGVGFQPSREDPRSQRLFLYLRSLIPTWKHFRAMFGEYNPFKRSFPWENHISRGARYFSFNKDLQPVLKWPDLSNSDVVEHGSAEPLLTLRNSRHIQCCFWMLPAQCKSNTLSPTKYSLMKTTFTSDRDPCIYIYSHFQQLGKTTTNSSHKAAAEVTWFQIFKLFESCVPGKHQVPA